ncbi:MAG: cytochrome B, partial [Stutzerimonas stutzeri]
LLAAMLMRRGLSRLAGLLIAALALQVGLGISNVVFNLPLAVAVAHNGGGAALLLVLVLVNYRLRQPAHATRQTEPASISNTTGQLDLPRA